MVQLINISRGVVKPHRRGCRQPGFETDFFGVDIQQMIALLDSFSQDWRAPSLKMESRPGESEPDFQVRIADRLREDKEAAVEKLVDKFQVKKDRLVKKLDSAYAKLEKEKSDVSTKTTDTILSFGTAVLGAFLGRKKLSSSTMTRTASGIRKAGRIGKEKDDVRRAEELAVQLEEELEELEIEQRQALEELADSYDPAGVETETFAIKPRRSDIFDVQVCLLWEMVPPHISS